VAFKTGLDIIAKIKFLAVPGNFGPVCRIVIGLSRLRLVSTKFITYAAHEKSG
jgi:hypothetical protein